MSEVQKSLKSYFNSNSFFNTLMAIDFVVYGAGLLLMIIGNFVPQVSDAFINLGLILFWVGVVFGYAKKNAIGLTVAFGAYALLFLIDFIVKLIGTTASYMGQPLYSISVFSFGALCHIALATVFLIPVIRNSEYYKKYQQNKQLIVKAAEVQVAKETADNCVSCGAALLQGAVFCPSCGAKQPEKKFCPSCGAEVAAGAAFCAKCGQKVAE